MIFSLQRRFLAFLLVPVVLFLVGTGFIAFLSARGYLLEQWEELAKRQLEKAAHQIRMHIDEKRELADLIAQAEQVPNGRVTQAFLVQKLRELPGVRFVDMESVDLPQGTPLSQVCNLCAGNSSPDSGHICLADPKNAVMLADETGGGALSGDSWKPSEEYHPECCQIELASEGTRRFLTIGKCYGGVNGTPHKRLTIRVSFDSFLDDVLEMGKDDGSYACLVTRDGEYLAHTDPIMGVRKRLGETGSPLEKRILKEIKSRHFGTIFGEGNPPEIVVRYHKVPTTDWYVVLFSDGRKILAPIIRFRTSYFVAGIIVVIVIAYLIRLNTVPVARSVRQISEAAERVEEGDYTGRLPEDSSDEIGQLKARFNEMVTGLKQRDLIERTFGRYVDKNIAREMMKKPEALRLGGKRHAVTIMMADLRGFTSMAEKLEPEEVITILNRYFARMIDVIDRHRGIIVDFYGDSVLVFFNGVDSAVHERAGDAVTCALTMQEKLAQLSAENVEHGLPELRMGIGIHTGEVVVGNIGSETRAKYGIVGSPVNEVHRIQSKALGGSVLISEQTYELVSDRVDVAATCETTLKGLDGDRCLYEVDSIDVRRKASEA